MRSEVVKVEPKFQHDCGMCEFIGHFVGHDVYQCTIGFRSVVARYGNLNWEYTSRPPGVLRAMIPSGPSTISCIQAMTQAVAYRSLSVGIVEEREEEKVGSKCEIVNECGRSFMKIYDVAITAMDNLAKDWQPGESRKVKSINFDTPSGVPDVIFEETPRERLKREFIESQNKVMPEQHKHLYAAVMNYLAATEGEK